MMTEPPDPWRAISPPDQAASVSGRRVDPAVPWGMFWAVDVDRNCLLILQHQRSNRPTNRLPRLRGLKVETRVPEDGSHDLLAIRLVDAEQREIFHRLCLDIISATTLAQTEEEAIERFLARTWRWHRLLRGGRDGRLSDEEQKGLIGELNVLRRLLFPTVGIQTAIRSWTGPLDAPKDFEVGRVCIEAKARRGAATPYVAISTEHQLDTDGVDALFLHVSEITGASEEDRKAVTVTDVAHAILDDIKTRDLQTVELFEERLTAAGLDWMHDYSDMKWLQGPQHLFEVRDEFPRVTPSLFSTGVSNVRYSISLPDCEPFRSNHEQLRNVILGGLHGDQC